MLDQQSPLPAAGSLVAIRLRARCVQRGWDLAELSRRSGVALSTLHEIAGGRTARPQLRTLMRIADALEISVAELWAGAARAGAAPASPEGELDRLTNPCIAETVAEVPQAFQDWTPADWDSLYSRFGTGGPLTREGVLESARRINRRRETVRQLQIVLETHLEAVASELVGTLYRMVRPASNLERTAELESLLKGREPPGSCGVIDET